jgi:hypothetical protein
MSSRNPDGPATLPHRIARNAIPKQTLDDPEQLVLQDQRTVQAPPASFSSRHH